MPYVLGMALQAHLPLMQFLAQNQPSGVVTLLPFGLQKRVRPQQHDATVARQHLSSVTFHLQIFQALQWATTQRGKGLRRDWLQDGYIVQE